MIIEFEIDYQLSTCCLPVSVTATIQDHTCIYNNSFDLSQPRNQINIVTDQLTLLPHTVTVVIATDDIEIVNTPLEIKNITLDQHFSTKQILHSGHAEYSQQFLQYARDKNFYLDQNIVDTNRLDFTGELIYKFKWPFYQNVWKQFRNLRK